MRKLIISVGIIALIVFYILFDAIPGTTDLTLSASPAVRKNLDSKVDLTEVKGLEEIIAKKGLDKLLDTLDELNVNGFFGTNKNIKELDERFRLSKDIEEKIRLARLYNSAYFHTEDNLVRQDISRKLTALLRSEDNTSVGRALAFSHSRLIFDNQTKENLSTAFAKKFLTEDDYYGELAHVFQGAPDSSRSEIISEISKSRNRYASEITADLLINSPNPGLPKADRLLLIQYLNEFPPGFGATPTSFGMTDAIRYEQWLRAIANLESQDKSVSPELLIFQKLSARETDPRAAIAFLLSPEAEKLVTMSSHDKYMSELKHKALEFINQNPSATALQQIGAQISRLFSKR